MQTKKGVKMQQKLIQESINSALGKIANLTKELGLDQEQVKEIMNNPDLQRIQQMENLEEKPLEELPDEVELPWEKVSDLFNMKSQLFEIQNYLAQLCVRFEVTKSKVVEDLSNVEKQMNHIAADLKVENGIPISAPYEVQIPEEPNTVGTLKKITTKESE